MARQCYENSLKILTIKTSTKEKKKNTKIGEQMKITNQDQLVLTLRKNVDLFSWRPSGMPGIDTNFLCYRLALYVEAKPEVDYTTWLSNIVLVKKSNGKWRMCIDYIDLNKACLKDFYPLSSIDRLVDGAFDFKVLSFLDAFSSYD
ncbi:hypothetical protein CR513_54013, partial [Mucuna pruriens]